MPVPSSINDLSTTAGSNSPSGSESPTTTDDYLRTLSAFIAILRDGKAADSAVLKLTGAQTAAGQKTFSDGIVGNLTGNVTGNASGLSSTLAIGSGGTGQTTASAAFGALKQDASESASGVLEIADTSESQALSSNARAITPARLATSFQGANQSLGSTGFQRLPGGIILQWGYTSVASGSQSVSFATPFPNGVYMCVATAGGSNGGNNTTSSTSSIGTSGFTINNQTGVTSNWSWFAIGR